MTDVLCIPKRTLSVGLIPFNGIFTEYSYIPREYADDDNNVVEMSKYPQLIPYVVVKCDDEYLTYQRKGNETRLHGKYSFGFGGHIDSTDLVELNSTDDLIKPVRRELLEELGLTANNYTLDFKPMFIYSEKTNVDKVHIGLIVVCNLQDKNNINPDGLEIINPKWKSMSSIRANMGKYETWSYLTAKYLDQ